MKNKKIVKKFLRGDFEGLSYLVLGGNGSITAIEEEVGNPPINLCSGGQEKISPYTELLARFMMGIGYNVSCPFLYIELFDDGSGSLVSILREDTACDILFDFEDIEDLEIFIESSEKIVALASI